MSVQTQKMYLRNESMAEKIVRHKLFWVLFILFGFSFPIYKSLNRTLPPELPIIKTVSDFEFISENGQRFGSKNLVDRVYLATFLAASSPESATKLKELEKIQKRIRGTGHKVAIVTFSVNPQIENENILFNVAREHKANPFHWTFLTDFDAKKLADFYETNFEVKEMKNQDKIVLVDQANRVRAYYQYTDYDINKLMIDVGLLINRPPTKE